MILYRYLEKRGFKDLDKIVEIYNSQGIFIVLCYVHWEDHFSETDIKQTDCLARAIIGWELEYSHAP